MNPSTRKWVQLVIDVEVEVAGVERLGDPAAAPTRGQVEHRLLEVVLADPELTSFFCRHAAAVPLTDWLRGEPLAELEWLREEPQKVAEAIRRLAPVDQALLGPVLEGRLDGELDRFYAAFRPSYRGVRVILLH